MEPHIYTYSLSYYSTYSSNIIWKDEGFVPAILISTLEGSGLMQP